MKLSKIATIISLTLITIIGLGVLGYAWNLNKSQDLIFGSLKHQEKPTSTPEVITSELDTSSWLTYRNEEFGFEVRYPGSWNVHPIDNIGIGLIPPDKKPRIEYNGDIKIFIRNNPELLSMQEFYDGSHRPNLFKDALGGYESIKIDSRSAIKFNDVIGLVTSDIIVIPLENQFIEIEAIANFTIFESAINLIKIKK